MGGGWLYFNIIYLLSILTINLESRY